MLNLTFRFLFLFIFVTISMKLLGKRQIGEMQMSEFVTAFFLSELATYAVTDSNVPILYGIVPTFLLISLEVIISFLTLKSKRIKQLFDFSPDFVIYEGEIIKSALQKNRITLDELMSLLRSGGHFDLNGIRFAILEPNGLLSVVLYSDNAQDGGFYVPLICDGRISYSGLKILQKDQQWLRQVLCEHQIFSEKDVFLLAVDFAGNVKISLKEGKAT